MIVRENGGLLLKGNYIHVIFGTLDAHDDLMTRELVVIADMLKPLEAQNRAKGFITAGDDAGRIKDCIQQVERALAAYQVCLLTRETNLS
jgi:hypothetical protein